MTTVKKIVWNSSNVAFFWDTYLRRSNKAQVWMSEGSGEAISRRMKRMLPRAFFSSSKTICDWGCGKGKFGKKLALRSHRVFGLDQTEVIENIQHSVPNFTAIDDSRVIKNQEVDLVYAIEVIEHIIDSEIHQTFLEWRRILKRNGYLVITTPNDENLDENSIVCPNCKTSFHSVQHVRTLNAESLTTLMNKNGFEVKNIWLGEFFYSTNRGFALEILRKLKFQIRRCGSRIRQTKPPHMMALCTLKHDLKNL